MIEYLREENRILREQLGIDGCGSAMDLPERGRRASLYAIANSETCSQCTRSLARGQRISPRPRRFTASATPQLLGLFSFAFHLYFHRPGRRSSTFQTGVKYG